jgi:hypothetical protein
MTRVCLVGDAELNLRYELLSRETAREALSTYDLHEPYVNTVGLETVSLGAAVSLLNDLNWYLVRFVDQALVLEPSVSENEWLSRAMATRIRDDAVDPEETGRHLMVYGVRYPSDEHADEGPPGQLDLGGTGPDAAESDRDAGDSGSDGADSEGPAVVGEGDDGHDDSEDGHGDSGPPVLTDPMYLARTGETIPDYDLHDVSETLVVRVTETEFEA